MNIIRDKSLAPYEIEIDEHNYTVQMPKNGHKKLIGYHNTLRSAIMRIIRLKSSQTGDVVTLNEFLENVEGVTKPIIDRLSI